MKNGFTFISLSLLTVAGCSGGGGSDPETPSPETVAAAQVSMGIVPSMVTVDYDEATNVLTVTDGVTTRELAARAFYDTPGFAGYYVSSTGQHYGSGAETSSGGGRVAVVTSPSTSLSVSGAFMERTGDTVVPVTGTATYTGDYASWFVTASGLSGSRLVTGAATLNVDFADSSVDGMITDRENHFSSETFADIVLVEGSIVDGQFSGTTTGGGSSIAGATAAAGEYLGLLTGANAEEAVGGVHLTHTISGTDYVETGAFVVE